MKFSSNKLEKLKPFGDTLHIVSRMIEKMIRRSHLYIMDLWE